MKKLFQLILDLLFPLHCLNCHQEGSWLCQKCENRLPINPSYERFERILVFSACDYKKIVIKKLITTCKFSSIEKLSHSLGKLLIKGALQFPEIKDLLVSEVNNRTKKEEEEEEEEEEEKKKRKNRLIIIPIPLSKKRERERGFNQSLIIAQELSNYFQLPLLNNLERVERKPQSELEGKKRTENIKGAFTWKGKNLNDYKIILVDDVVTTGATLAEAAKELKKIGAKKVIGFAVAR